MIRQGALVSAALFLSLWCGSASAQSVYSDVRILQIGVHNQADGADVEIFFDKPVCVNFIRYAHLANLIKTPSGNFTALLSMILAAFTSNRSMRIQTADDASCAIQTLRVQR